MNAQPQQPVATGAAASNRPSGAVALVSPLFIYSQTHAALYEKAAVGESWDKPSRDRR